MQERLRDNLIQRLDRHLEWIKSCDTKASIVLAMIGIFLTLFLSEQSLVMLKKILTQSMHTINFSNILYLLIFAFSWCIFIYGAFCLVKVLVPKNKEVLDGEGLHRDSLYYFETTASNSFSEFKRRVLAEDESDELNDILSQIYVNAQICSIKYEYFKKGIKFSFLGIASTMSVYLIGVFLAYIGGFS
ncbi:Pycsar system effector family protein [Bacillus inaquosorum]|uniref:Pycsar system effector family protein n=1 Tax=Bacillus inaquosorum TaxID=483913 RepID=UPI003D059F3E